MTWFLHTCESLCNLYSKAGVVQASTVGGGGGGGWVLGLAVPGLTVPWNHAIYLWLATAISFAAHEVHIPPPPPTHTPPPIAGSFPGKHRVGWVIRCPETMPFCAWPQPSALQRIGCILPLPPPPNLRLLSWEFSNYPGYKVPCNHAICLWLATAISFAAHEVVKHVPPCPRCRLLLSSAHSSLNPARLMRLWAYLSMGSIPSVARVEMSWAFQDARCLGLVLHAMLSAFVFLSLLPRRCTCTRSISNLVAVVWFILQ